VLIKACMNGAREPGEHPGLPLMAEELAVDAALVVAAGAGALHIHPRGVDGKQSLAAEDHSAAIVAIRRRCPGIAVGVSTAIGIEPDVALRLRRVEEWTSLPDFASVNFEEPGAVDLSKALLKRGIGVEASLSSVEEVEMFLKSGLAERCLRILIEPIEEEAEAALTTTGAIIEALDKAANRLPRLLHGFEATTWPVLEAALAYGYDTRIGLEDTLNLPDGKLASDNAELVALAVKWAAR
jgi:uncharacterized protein (DUF849 family)